MGQEPTVIKEKDEEKRRKERTRKHFAEDSESLVSVFIQSLAPSLRTRTTLLGCWRKVVRAGV